jgi:hypothetical protein
MTTRHRFPFDHLSLADVAEHERLSQYCHYDALGYLRRRRLTIADEEAMRFRRLDGRRHPPIYPDERESA